MKAATELENRKSTNHLEFSYPGIQMRQTDSSNMLTFFAAPATDIAQWAGIPQKKLIGEGEETIGFQRDDNKKRISSLCDFYANSENIIQNPLLCAIREIPNSTVRFEALDNPLNSTDIQFGNILINFPKINELALSDLFALIRSFIENRIELPADFSKLIDEKKVELKERYQQDFADGLDNSSNARDEEASENGEQESQGENESFTSVLFEESEESHLLEFWLEIAARHELLKDLESFPDNKFMGFEKDGLISYILPIVLVDGQHRLLGAIKAVDDTLLQPEIKKEIENRIAKGEDAASLKAELRKKYCRRLPISLLMSSDPAEQVFQFVVVNQKATPVGKALLGSIISTTLSSNEMNTVSTRLENAGIQVDESKAIAYMARNSKSPFANLVERGLAGNAQTAKHLLQWNVLGSIISIFRDLHGGQLFGFDRNTYAQIWRDRHLESSELASAYKEKGFDSHYAYWRQLDGPWRDVFIAFWTEIKAKFGSTDERNPSYWGSTNSNLYNKISLTILAADFFQYLTETKQTIRSVDHVKELVKEWLEYVDEGYFARDWNLSGIKKDSPGTRDKWAEIWVGYRKAGGRLPDYRGYRQARTAQ